MRRNVDGAQIFGKISLTAPHLLFPFRFISRSFILLHLHRSSGMFSCQVEIKFQIDYNSIKYTPDLSLFRNTVFTERDDLLYKNCDGFIRLFLGCYATGFKLLSFLRNIGNSEITWKVCWPSFVQVAVVAVEASLRFST